MKIAINTLGPSKVKVGIGNYVVSLVNWLQKTDKENEYLIFVGKENEHFFKKAKNFKFHNIGVFNKNWLIRIIWEQLLLPSILRRKKIDILHSPGFVSPILKNTKQIVTIHDMTFFTHSHFHLSSKVKYFGKLIPISIQRADMVITDSESTKKDIIKLLKTDSNKIKTVHLGTDFKPKIGAQTWIRQKYKIKSPFVLYTGTIEPRKNIANLIRAYAKIASKIKQQLVIVGKKGWMYDEVFELVEKLGLKERVIFAGYIPDKDLESFYSAADLFIYPSYYEGFGIPVVEAMACGCPVITSNNSSLSEIASGAALLINNPDDIDEIARKMQRVILNKKLQKTLKQKGFARSKVFSWEKTAEKTLRAYKAL